MGMLLNMNDTAIIIVTDVGRIAGLEPIVGTVVWVQHGQEPSGGLVHTHLPPLEVTKEQLQEQEEFEAVRADIAAHQEPWEKVEELAQRFLREMEVGVVIFQSRCENSGSLFVFGWVVSVITPTTHWVLKVSLPLVPILICNHGQRQMRGNCMV